MRATPPSATAPIPNSGWVGAPTLRATNTSSGASRARATSKATGTPPRGSANTSGDSNSCPPTTEASRRPASIRSRKRIGVLLLEFDSVVELAKKVPEMARLIAGMPEEGARNRLAEVRAARSCEANAQTLHSRDADPDAAQSQYLCFTTKHTHTDSFDGAADLVLVTS